VLAIASSLENRQSQQNINMEDISNARGHKSNKCTNIHKKNEKKILS
jgi:hypothetical protein